MHTPRSLSPSPRRPQKTEALVIRTRLSVLGRGCLWVSTPRSPAASPRWPGQRSAFGRCPPHCLSAGRTTVFGEGGIPSGTQTLWALDAFLRVVLAYCAASSRDEQIRGETRGWS